MHVLAVCGMSSVTSMSVSELRYRDPIDFEVIQISGTVSVLLGARNLLQRPRPGLIPDSCCAKPLLFCADILGSRGLSHAGAVETQAHGSK